MPVDLQDKIKASLRVKTDVFDELEILPLIDAAKQDLRRSGIDYYTHTERELCDRAIIIYCKIHFGAGAPDAEQLSEVHETLKAFLATGEWGDVDGAG